MANPFRNFLNRIKKRTKTKTPQETKGRTKKGRIFKRREAPEYHITQQELTTPHQWGTYVQKPDSEYWIDVERYWQNRTRINSLVEQLMEYGFQSAYIINQEWKVYFFEEAQHVLYDAHGKVPDIYYETADRLNEKRNKFFGRMKKNYVEPEELKEIKALNKRIERLY